MSAAGSVLILTHPFDPTADKVVDELNRRGVTLFRCDAADFPERLLAGAQLCGTRWSGQLQTTRRRLELDDITGIYYRRPTAFEFHQDLSDDERQWAGIQARMGFGGLLASLDQWLNHPHNIGYADYKPVQLRQAAACGLRVPRTLITNDPEAAQQFVTSVGQAVCKPFGGAGVWDEDGFQHVFTTKVTADQCADPNISRTMHIVQEWVPKHHEIRLTVVDGRFFAARIDAESEAAYIDWRSDYHSISYSVVETPDFVRSAVRTLLDSMGLRFAALDFIVDPDGRWWFMEFTDRSESRTSRSCGPVTSASGDRLPARFGTSVLFRCRGGGCGADGAGRGSEGSGDQSRRGLAVVDGAVARGRRAWAGARHRARYPATDLPTDVITQENNPFEFFAALTVPGGGWDHVSFIPSNGDPAETWLAQADGSWVCHTTAPDGSHTVRQGGPGRFWDQIETAHRQWRQLGQPTRGRFGLTIANGHHTIWLDHRDGPHQWPLLTAQFCTRTVSE